MAVILGLLLVVTFIANYLTTELPNTMAQNDLQHEVTVQNQVAQLSALVERVAEARAVGAQVSQPVTLGSPSSPPFAGQDAATISGGNVSANMGVTFTLTGPTTFRVPTGSASVLVQLHNTYAPSGEVSLDQGAVVYAQPGASPIFVVVPRISLVNGTLSMLVPQFVGSVGFEAGVGTADVSLRLLSAQVVKIPSNGASLSGATPVTITIKTPYAAAWYAYFLGYAGLSTDVTCTGPSNVCSPTYLYQPGGPLGTVTLSVPTAGLSLAMLVALYSVTIE